MKKKIIFYIYLFNFFSFNLIAEIDQFIEPEPASEKLKIKKLF